MDLEIIKRQKGLSWVAITLLVLLCAVLGVLQYRWIGEVAAAERQRLQNDLQSRLDLLRRNLNDQISSACYAYIPTTAEILRLGRDEAYLLQYRSRLESHDPIVRRIALAVPRKGDLALLFPDRVGDHFTPGDWPPQWTSMRERLLLKVRGGPITPNRPQISTLLEFPRFGPAQNNSANEKILTEQEWLLLELNQSFIGGTLIPEMVRRYLGDPDKPDYDSEIVLDANPSAVIYKSPLEPGEDSHWIPDASVKLLEVSPMPNFPDGPTDRSMPSSPASSPGLSAQGVWLLRVHRHAGSLDTIVIQARRRNLVLSAGLLLLIIATIAALVRFSRQSQKVAELQMNFVAGVSHELRTPLTVIRTAAFNLRGNLANQPAQVARYGALIQKEGEKLSALVDQVLRYGNVTAGRVLDARAPLAISDLIEGSLRESRIAVENPQLIVEKKIDEGLPPVLADEVALQHALRNLLDNAVKYGAQPSNWIGVFASAPPNGAQSTVEIRIADRGPGIPPDELENIFDSFFRGKRALQDQIHGTGLGLSLVKKIVEAHGGTINIRSREGEGVEFTIRIPAIAPDQVPGPQDESANSPG
jgi:signal transduction histidine kinase